MNTQTEKSELTLWFNGKCFCVGDVHQFLEDGTQIALIKGFENLSYTALQELAYRLNNSNIPEDIRYSLGL
ncbi:MAG: hypothetical protein RJQ14_14860 [Marinoscillum sp.]